MLHAYIDESGTHADSDAVAVVAALAEPAVWERFRELWRPFLHHLGLGRWHHRDFDNRRYNYGALADKEWVSARDRLCEIIIELGLFIGGAAIARSTYREVAGRGKWKLPDDPYEFCLERCFHQVINRVYSKRPDKGVDIFYDNEKQFGRIAREVVRWHKETFEPNRLSEFDQRRIELRFTATNDAPALAVPDILAFEACEYVRADTGIPFLGARLTVGETPEPRPIITKLSDAKVPMMVVAYDELFLDLDLSQAGVSTDPVPRGIAWGKRKRRRDLRGPSA